MLEIRFHGRGGQGTVLAAKILADAVLLAGKAECMAIPEFGVERRGAPVTAYARISSGKILLRSRIYEPDAVVLMDPTVAAGADIVKGLKPGGALVLNTEAPLETLEARYPGFKLYAVPARRIAIDNKLGPVSAPMVNTAMVGAVCAIFSLADPASVEKAIRDNVPSRHDANALAARQAAAAVLWRQPCPS